MKKVNWWFVVSTALVCIVWIGIVFVISGCTSVQSKHIEKASEVCEANGGISTITNQITNVVVTCGNGARFFISAGGNE